MASSEQIYKNEYQPDVLEHPGMTLRDYIEDAGMSVAEFTKRTGWTEPHVHKILNGTSRISHEFALVLEKIFNVPARFWNNMQNQYDEFVAKQKEQASFAESLDWAREFPYPAMVKEGWLPDVGGKAEKKLEELLSFFGIGSPVVFRSFWDDRIPAFKASGKLATCPKSVACWVRQAERIASNMDLPDYNKQRFVEVLDEIREGVTEDLVQYQRRMKALCAEAGVCLIFLPTLPKMAIGGVTFWNNGSPVIVLSLRWNSDDHIWFNFFHEAKHVLQEVKKKLFIDNPGEAVEDPKEIEANNYAATKLIDAQSYHRFVASNPNPGAFEIRHFAKELNVTPGVVLGQLQHRGVVSFASPLNRPLKKRFKFENRQ